MKIKKHTQINKLVIIVPLVAIACALAVGVYFFAQNKNNKGEGAQNASHLKEGSSDKDQAENLQKNPDKKTTAPNADKPTEPTPVSGSTKNQVQMIASVDQSNGTVYIRGGINYPARDGSCYAQLTGPAGQSVRKESPVLPNPASTDCKTISIPASELAPGKWTLTLHYTSNEFEGASSELSFTL